MRRLGSGIGFIALCVLLGVTSAVRAQPEANLPHYDLRIVLDVNQHTVRVHQVVTWTNRAAVPTREVVFNAHAHYSIPDKDIGFLAKTVEILRMAPKESLNFDGPA